MELESKKCKVSLLDDIYIYIFSSKKQQSDTLKQETDSFFAWFEEDLFIFLNIDLYQCF